MGMTQRVLQLDVRGMPQSWISPQEAAGYYATDTVAWTVGDPLVTLRGGVNARSGLLSKLVIHPIVAVKGSAKINLEEGTPSLTNAALFRRYTCCWCGNVFSDKELTREHIIPTSRGGENSWINCASSCSADNSRRGNSLPEEAGMKLLYLPYRPSRWEGFLLSGRNIRADVHEFLAARLPKGSRLS